MRKFYVYAALAAATLTGFTACSDSDDVASSTTSSDANEHFISVNIRNTESGTKAATRADGGYASGSPVEGAVSKIRFFFFNQDGTPYALTNSTPSGVNWIDVTPTSMTSADPEGNPTTIESYSNAIVVIDGSTGTTPDYMLAVANPDALTNPNNTTTSTTPLLSADRSMSLNQLKSTTLLSTTYRQGTDGNFVMTNSVYGDANNSLECETPTAGYLKTSRKEATDNPVDIYVERLAAKVTVTHPAKTEDPKWDDKVINNKTYTTYDLGEYAYAGGTISHVYAVIQGWGLADEQQLGKVEKDVTGFDNEGSGWRSNLGFDGWNSAINHRSFWEVTPTFDGSADNPVDYPFNSYNKNFQSVSNTANDIAYTMPNTPSTGSNSETENRNSNQTYRTKVLLAAKLMYQDPTDNSWKEAEVCSYRGQNYLGEDAVKAQVLVDIQDHIVKRTTTPEGATRWANLTADDISFATTNATNVKSYQVVPVLDPSNEYAISSLENATAETPTVSIDAANKEAQLYAPAAEIRKTGDTYYYTAIRHLATDETAVGYFGVVRNHWYQVNITGITGWGTPVYNPGEKIIPVTPSDERTYLAAKINVLQWHVITNDYNIDGTAKH